MKTEKVKRSRCFVIQPFGVKKTSNGNSLNNDLIFSQLKKLENNNPIFPLEVYRADTENIERENLHSHVSDCIKNSHFCIVDLNGRNSNVIYELGYARGLNKKVIILCHDKDEIPGDMNGAMYIEYGKNDIEDLNKYFENDLEKIPYLPKRNDTLIKSKLRNAKTKITILQTNLSILNYELIDDIAHAMNSNDSLELRILTLDPESIFVNFRANQLGDTKVEIFRNDLKNSLDNINYRLRDFGSRSRIRTYDDFPAQIAFHIDNVILACVVSSTGRSRDNCAFLLPDTMLGAQKSFVEHFEKLWNGDKSKEYCIRSITNSGPDKLMENSTVVRDDVEREEAL